MRANEMASCSVSCSMTQVLNTQRVGENVSRSQWSFLWKVQQNSWWEVSTCRWQTERKTKLKNSQVTSHLFLPPPDRTNRALVPFTLTLQEPVLIIPSIHHQWHFVWMCSVTVQLSFDQNWYSLAVYPERENMNHVKFERWFLKSLTSICNEIISDLDPTSNL